jgi:hypothetical protein
MGVSTLTMTRTRTRCGHEDAVRDLLEGDGAPFFLSWCRTCGASKRGCYDEPSAGEGIRGTLWEHDWRLPTAPPDLDAASPADRRRGEEAVSGQHPPGPPDPPITPGAQGWPDRDKLNALVATLGVFEWCEANGLLDAEKGEFRRARDAFMFDWGPTAERWREQTGEEPSWSQYAFLIRDNQRLRAQASAPPDAPGAFEPSQMVSARDLQRGLGEVLGRLGEKGSLLVLHHGQPAAVLTTLTKDPTDA